MKIEVQSEVLQLLPDGALWWPARKILALSDVHLGKAQSFRREGIALPLESGLSDLEKLAALIHRWEPRQVLILGDFIHHRTSWTRELKAELYSFFTTYSSLQWLLILGNHEKGSLEPLKDLPLVLTSEDVDSPPFRFTHGHRPAAEGFQVSGHVHPVITLKRGPLRMRCPCFVLKENELILPSFGTWTGGWEIKPRSDLRVFAIAGHDVFEVEGRTSSTERSQES